MKNKYLVLILCLCIVAFSMLKPSVVLANDSIYSDVENRINGVYEDDVDLFFAPVAIPVAQAFGYLMGAFGVVAGSTAIYENADAIEEFFSGEVEKFKLKCTALGLGATVVENWLSNLASGVVQTSSDVFDAFKSFLTDVFTDVKAPVYGGSLVPEVKYDFSSDVGKSFYDAYFSPSSSEDIDASSKPFLIAVNSYTSGYNIYCVSPYKGYFYYKEDGWSSTLSLTNSLYGGSVNGTFYYWGNRAVLTAVPSYGNIPYVDTKFLDTALREFLGADKNSGTYKNVGTVEDLAGTNIFNPGATASSDVAINWDAFDSAGVITGLGTGALTWDEALVSGGISVKENDVVIGGVIEEDIPGEEVKPGEDEDVVPELGSLGAYAIPLAGLFPFCLPFDLIDFINILAQEPQAPYFEYTMALPSFINNGSYTFVIDLSPFDGAAKLLRSMETLVFIVGLIMITRSKMIRG